MFVISSSVHIQSFLGNFEPSSGFLSHKHGDLFQVVILFIIQLSMNICTRPAGR